MVISPRVRERVRQRAQYACEYCGVSEVEVGGELTVDHFRPRSAGGSNDIANLIYCCIHCNQNKHAYWPNFETAPILWNPREESISSHIIELDDGSLQPLSSTGAFTLRLLRLNRPAMIANRLRKQHNQRQARWFTQLQELAVIYQNLIEQQSHLLTEQRALLEEQRNLIRLLSQRL